MADTSQPSIRTSMSGLRVVLEVLNGPFEGRKAWLRAGQTLRIGRTERSDFALPHDAKMSNLHFALECGLGGCRVLDCGSTNGTLVNDAPVTEQALADGDIVTAGNTRFRLRVEGAQPQAAAGAGGTVLFTAPKHAPPAATAQTLVRYRLNTCTSGLALMAGDTAEVTPAQIAGQLARTGLQLVLIADFAKANQPLPPELEQPEFLFQWMPAEVARCASPVVLTRDAAVDPFGVLGTLWGQQAVVAFFTTRPKEQFVEHLRGIIQGRKKPDGPLNRQTLIGVCWPGILGSMLRDGPSNSHAYLYSHTSAVFVEGESPEEWQLFVLPDMAPKLQKMGFTPAPPSAPPTEPAG